MLRAWTRALPLDSGPRAAEDFLPLAVRNDLPALAAAAHKLKSSAGILCINPLDTLLNDVERLAEQAQTDPLPALVEATVATAAAAVDEFATLRPLFAP